MNDARTQVDSIVGSMDGLPGWTIKIEIAGQDVYAKVAFYGERLVYVDVTISSMGGHDQIMTTARDATNEATKTDNARAMVELLCRQANVLLQSGVWAENDLIEAWMATRFEPDGLCWFQLFAEQNRAAFVSSPLDAVARILRNRLSAWRRVLRRRAEAQRAKSQPQDP